MLYSALLKARAEAPSRSTNLEKPKHDKHDKLDKHDYVSGLDSDGRVNGGVRV